MLRLLHVALCAALFPLPALAAPVPVKVVEVIDGDTFVIQGEWAVVIGKKVVFRVPGTVKVRVLGIDTPEKGPLALCPEEAAHSELATAYAKELLSSGAVGIDEIKHDKYGGRLDADPYVRAAEYKEAMIRAGFAQPYTGKGPKPDWCAILKGPK
jgi:endonuclease YncB( thermonuclease family)